MAGSMGAGVGAPVIGANPAAGVTPSAGYSSSAQGAMSPGIVGPAPAAPSPAAPAPAAPPSPAAPPAPAAPAAPAPAGPAAPNVFQQAQAATSGVMGYQPQNVTAGQIAGTDLSAYYNPFERQVVQQSLADIEQARLMQANQLAAQAQAAGAFGGSRSAILESQASQAAMEQAARTAANLRLGGFQQAQQMAAQDIASRMQAALANQQAGLAGAQLRLGAGQQGFQMGRTLQQDLAQQGALQQMLNQQIFDAARGQFEGYSSFPERSLGYMAAALGAAPVPQTTTTSRQPGLFDYLALGLSML